MPDPMKVETQEVADVPVVMISSSLTPAVASGTVAVTPQPNQPNLVVRLVTPLTAITVRFVNTFLTGLVGILTGAMATNVIQATDFVHLVYKCAGLAVAGAGMGLLKDLVTIFGKLEQTNPLLTGSV